MVNILDHNFEVKKENGFWVMIEPKSNVRVSLPGHKTKKECLKICEKMILTVGKKKLIQSINRHRRKNILMNEKIHDKFISIFKTPLIQFINPILKTFDIVQFDRWMKTPNNISLKDYLTKKYGIKTSNFIRALNRL